MEDKIFYHLLDALNTYRNCPLCQSRMTMHRGSSNDQVEYNYESVVIKNNDVTITIDIQTGLIDIEMSVEEDFNILNIKYPKRYVLDGLMMLGLVLECGNIKCTKYSYTIRLDLDIPERRFKMAMLNAEWVCIEDGPDVFEIRNSYGHGITKYSHHLSNGSTKSIEMPLVTINSSNPKETVDRLKKLIIFS